MKVLVVDPVTEGRDTLSTHALMRGGVLQLARWGLLDEIRRAGTPAIHSTTFHYGRESVRIPIEPRDGVDGLYAPRRTVLDPILVRAAARAGAQIQRGVAVTAVTGGRRADGVVVSDTAGATRTVKAGLVVGADGMRSRVASLVDAATTRTVPHATASIYGYVPGLDEDGYHWYFDRGHSVGTIPTNDGETCIYASLSPSRFLGGRGRGLHALFEGILGRVSPELLSRMAASGAQPRLRGFAGEPSILRQAVGPGWALVGDAGYFKDPLTAHGITDALRDAELLARAVLTGTTVGLLEYEAIRDRLSTPVMDVTSQIASLRWTLGELKELHRELSRGMASEVDHILGWQEARTAA
jgi:2-polyprenyl-6-methoxyphenol hydroxylase-like FAD-dependent oxidoreductase